MTCKFINADEPRIVAYNPYDIMSVFAFDYCEFNPVMDIDPDGYWSYNRTKVLNYIKKWYNSHNPNYINLDGKGGDCANFVSQCLFAGGFKMTYDYMGWYCKKNVFGTWGYSKYWVKANDLYFYFKVNFRKNQYEIRKHQDVLKYISKVKIGDLVFFDWTSDGKIDHAGIISSIAKKSDIFYAAHTSSRLYYSISGVTNRKQYKGKITIYIITLKDKY
ncbi:MAG: amidase domain-containing protein [Ruminococcus sp.]|nr:amidase domain-containing protein [Ruminococcus sp.]